MVTPGFPTVPLADIIQQQHSKLTGSDILLLSRGVRELHTACAGKLRVGTACSGTDLVIRALSLLLEHWQGMFGLTFRLLHEFACEIKEPKSDRLGRMTAPVWGRDP